MDAPLPFALADAAARSLHERFEAQAARTPDALAVIDGATVVSYRELNARANQLARALQARGVRREAVIAIALERSAGTIVSMLAILKAGGAYLPLDRSYPADRLRFMVADAGAGIVLTRAAAVEQRDGLAAPERCIDPDAIDLGQYARDDLLGASDPDGLAYVMYTSGSTGRPKGVLITHRAVVNLVTCTPAFAIAPDDVVAQMANISFDGATFEIWGALVNGARLEIIARDTMLAPAAFAACLRERRVSVAFLTSALLRHISRDEPGAFATLRCLIVGGEVVDPAAVCAIFAHGPPQRLLNGYGPTETTTFATTFEITAAPDAAIPIGQPIGNAAAYILDPAGNAVAPGVSGQLHIGGLGVARGYLNDPELTARKFIAQPFSADPRERIYATGDIARYLPDGNIEFVGRADRQIKIRGFRIELDEIEAALKALPAVADAVVMLREDEPGEKKIVAYVVDSTGPPRDIAQWRSELARQLPEHMLPEAVVLLAAIPLNANGKLDPSALSAAFPRRRASAGDSPDEPELPAERDVASIFADVLDVARTRRNDNFFALGGHSLLATRVIARIGDRFGVDLSLRDFFAGPTVAEVARRIGSAPRRADRLRRAANDARVAGLSDAEIEVLLAEALRE